MKKRTIITQICALFVVVASMLVASCSKSGGLLESVPEAAQVVIVADGSALAESMGLKMGPDGIAVPASLASIGGHAFSPDQLKAVGEIAPAVDIANVVFVAMSNTEFFMTVSVTDEGLFADKLDAMSGSSAVGVKGYKAWNAGGRVVVLLKDGQAWIADGDAESVARRVGNYIKAAGELSVADVEDVAAALTTAAPLRFGFNLGQASGRPESRSASQWATSVLSVKNNKLEVVGRLAGADGKSPLVGLTKIDPSFLKYIPPRQLAVAAVALDPSIDWEQRAADAANGMDFGFGRLLSALMPFLNSIDGTLAMSIAGDLESMIVNDMSIRNNALTVVARVKPGMADSVVGKVNTMIESMGFKGRDVDGTTVYAYEDIDVRVGHEGDVVLFTTGARTDSGDMALAPAFSGHGFAMVADLPALTFLSPMLPGRPSRLTATLDADGATLVYEVPGLKEPILKYLLHI